MNALYGENRFYRHVASHWIEMQQALIAMLIGGVFEFHPRLRVGFLEAQNSWAPGVLSRIAWDYPQYRDTHAPYLSLTPKEYFEDGAHLYAFGEGDFQKAAGARAATLGDFQSQSGDRRRDGLDRLGRHLFHVIATTTA